MEPSTEEMIAEVQSNNNADSVPSQDTQAQTGISEPPSQNTPSQEYEYQANGKTIKEPIDVILKRASQGYNYAQHMQDYKTKSGEVDSRLQKAVELENKYSEIDKYAQENPEWNDHLQKTWDSRFDVSGNQQNQDQAQTQQQANIPTQFLNEFNDMKSFVENMKNERADQAYQGAVQKVRDQYPDVDFSATDPNTGKSLEQQVLDFAEQNSIGKFEPAFKAFYSDQLIERARTQAKDQMASDIQQRNKAGLLGTSQTPSSNTQDDFPANFNQMSTDQLHNWIVDKYAT
jgi:hypothetical protein